MYYNIEYSEIQVDVKPDDCSELQEGLLLILVITKLNDDNKILELENEQG